MMFAILRYRPILISVYMVAALTSPWGLCQEGDAELNGKLSGLVADWNADKNKDTQPCNTTLFGETTEGSDANGHYFEFNGENSYIATDLRVSPDDLPESTWICRLLARRTDGRRLVLVGDDAGFDRMLVIEEGRIGLGTGTGIWTPTEIKTERWHHVAAVMKKSQLRLYVDGQEFIFSEPPGPQPSQSPLHIGGSPIWGQFFDGLIGRIQIYDRALEAEEIRADAKNQEVIANEATKEYREQAALRKQDNSLPAASTSPSEPEESKSPMAPSGDRTKANSWAGDFHIQTEEEHRVQAVGSLQKRFDGANIKEWGIFVPCPPELDSQKDISVWLVNNTTGKTKTGITKETSPLKRPMLQWEVRATQAEKSQFSYSYVFELTLVRRCVKPGKGTITTTQMSANDARRYTQTTPSIDWKTRTFQKWLEENNMVRRKQERDLAFAARVQAFLMERRLKQEEGTVVVDTPCVYLETAINVERPDCGTIATVFTGIMRANDIPARMRVGRWAGTGDPGNPYQVHVKTDFYGKGIGWINMEFGKPADPLDPEGAFGPDEGFITYHEDLGLEVEICKIKIPGSFMQWGDMLPIGKYNAESQSLKRAWTVGSLWRRDIPHQ